MIESIRKEQCTGCKMCADICPRNAISFKTDETGFWYPVVNENCIKCGKCIKRCPTLNEYKIAGQAPKVYALWSKNDGTRLTSTSGGVFWEIACKFLETDGIVVGSRYGFDWKSAEHIIAHDIDELLQIKGSKYFQSDTAGIYEAVKREILTGRRVLFCGTPCQMAAIKSYLEIDYKNFYCMDFICRSINSPKAFRADIDELEEEYNSKVIEVHLKNKKKGWQSLASQVRFENGKESLKDKTEDWWVKGFIHNDLYTRESCYQCKYRVLPRVNSDITIGDFWGIKNQTEENMFKGISVMLLNTDKGKMLFEDSKEMFEFEEHDLEEVLAGNSALLKNPIKISKQDNFFKLLINHPFSYSVKHCIKVPFFLKIKRKMIKTMKKIYRKIRFFTNPYLSITKYIYYNYLCHNVIRKGGAKIIPYKGTIINFAKDSMLYLDGKDLKLNTNKLKGSKSECHVRLDSNAVWNCNNGGYIFYNTVIEIKSNAIFNSGFFSVNGGSVIIAHSNINFGEDVMLGRNVIIYDSDFHAIYNKNGIACNPPKPVNIEDHVWLTSNIIVQKGVTIGKDSLITAYTTINRDVAPHSIFGGNSVGKLIKDEIAWGRETCPME